MNFERTVIGSRNNRRFGFLFMRFLFRRASVTRAREWVEGGRKVEVLGYASARDAFKAACLHGVSRSGDLCRN